MGRKKGALAEARLHALNPSINIQVYDARLTVQNALEIIRDYDIVADGSDHFATRYLVNDACFHLKKPNVYASISQFQGQCTIFTTAQGPCYRCIFETLPPSDALPNCAEAGVLGVLPGILGSIQALEVIKLILEMGQPLIGRLLLFDALSMSVRTCAITTNPKCRLCSDQKPFEKLLRPVEVSCSLEDEITPAEFAKLQEKAEEFILLDVREPHEYADFNLDARLIPLGELPQRFSELDKQSRIIVHCQHGRRSLQAAAILREAGFLRVTNLTGGVVAWREYIQE